MRKLVQIGTLQALTATRYWIYSPSDNSAAISEESEPSPEIRFIELERRTLLKSVKKTRFFTNADVLEMSESKQESKDDDELFNTEVCCIDVLCYCVV